MKVGKIPVASIVLLIIAVICFIMQRIYPGQYKFDSPFFEGAFFGAGLVYILYYLNTWITAYTNSRKEAEDNSTV
jgi:hypothetical protein